MKEIFNVLYNQQIIDYKQDYNETNTWLYKWN